MKNIIALCVMVVLVGSLSSCNPFVLFKCVDGYKRPDYPALQAQVRQNKALWVSKNIKSYEYTLEYLSFGPQLPIRVTVRAGTVTQAKVIPNPQRPDGSDFTPSDLQTLTMEAHFASLERSVTSPGDCDSQTLQFDATYGFPSETNSAILERNLADGFGGMKITAFTVTP
jgi:Family of unknown function (DUF6174)